MSLKHSLCLGVVLVVIFFFKTAGSYHDLGNTVFLRFLSKHLNCVCVFCLRILSWYITMGHHHLGIVLLFISTSEQANPSCVFILDRWTPSENSQRLGELAMTCIPEQVKMCIAEKFMFLVSTFVDCEENRCFPKSHSKWYLLPDIHNTVNHTCGLLWTPGG